MREFYSYYQKISEIEKRKTIKSNKELNLKSTYKFTRRNQTLAIIIESKQICKWLHGVLILTLLMKAKNLFYL